MEAVTASPRIFPIAVTMLALFALAAPASAQQTLTWDPSGVAPGTGGTGPWNTTTVAWDNGGVFQAWSNAPLYSAIFDGTAGTVTLGVPIVVRSLTFNASAYILTGSTLTLGGIAPTIDSTPATTTTIASAIAGTAGLTTSGAGTLTLSGVNSYAGGLTVNGTGTTILTGTNTYTGGTTITSGTLQVGNGGATGTLGPGGVTNAGALVFNRNAALTMANAIDGTGSLTQVGAGTISLTGANTYTGPTTIAAGRTLSVGAGGATGTLGNGLSVVNNGTLQLNRTGTVTLGQDISGTGTLTKIGTGVATLTGTNTYAGPTTITGGTLEVGNGGTTGTLGAGNVTVTGATSRLQINRSDALTVGQEIGGTGGLTQAGPGTTILTGANTYSGTTTIAAGTLHVGDGGATGQLGTGAVTNTGALVFNRGDALTVANAISGAGTVFSSGAGTLTLSGVNSYAGGLTVNGTGTTILTGTNTYTGGTTITSGTLQVGNGGATGTLGPGGVTNAGALVFNRNAALTMANAIDGTGSLTQVGAGTISLTGANTYTGPTTIAAGRTLSVGAGGATGTLGNGLSVVNNGTLQLNRTGTVTLGQDISGTGTLTKIGTGVATLTGTNTYAGPTTITGGTLEVGNGGTTGTLGAGDVTVTGATSRLQINRSDALTVGQEIGGTGGLTQAGPGTTILTGANTYSGTTTIAAGTLHVGDGGATGQLGTGAVTNTGALVFNRGDALTVANAISGAGTVFSSGAGTLTLSGVNSYAGGLTVNGTGTTILTGTNTYTGGTTITSGTLQVGNGGATGTLGPGGVTNAGALVFNRNAALTMANAIDGTGSLTQVGAGTISLTGANTYTGPTTIAAGRTLSVGAGGATGTLGNGLSVVNNGTLQLNRTGTVTLDQDISGTGTLTKIGTGVATLTGTNTYAGPTTITGGTLEVGNGGTTGTLGAGNVTVTGATSRLQINRSDALTVGQEIGGTGGLTQAGPGTTILTGANTYSGTTTIAAGTLHVGDGGATGQLGTGAVTNTGALVFNRGDALTVANAISGAGTVFSSGAGTLTLSGVNSYAGGLTVNGTGTTILTGTNTYTGGTTITSGTLQVGNGGATGTLGPGGVTNAGALVFNRNAALTMANAIDGTGSLTQVGAGTISLTGANTYTGPTTIAAGRTLSVGAGGATGTLGNGLSVVNNGTLQLNRTGTVTLGQDISGTGTLTKIGTGVATLTGTNTYAGPTTITGGTLEVGNGGTTGTLGAGNVTVTGATSRLQINRSDALTVGQEIGGTGGLTQAGPGTTILTGANTYSGTTTIAAGTLHVGDGGATGQLGTGAVTNTGALVFNRGDALTVANAINGTGSLTQAGAGTISLTGANTYTGTTTIAAGRTLSVGAGGATGTLGNGLSVVNDGTLQINRTGTVALGQDISGTGTLTKIGSGVATLTGANTYAGPTTISAGTLRIGNGGATGTLGTGSVTVDAGATLAFNRNNAYTVSSTIAGAGTLSQIGSGVTTLGAASNSVGSTIVTGGTLDVAGTLTTPTVAMSNNTTLNVSGALNAAGSVQTAITGSGGINIVNSSAGAAILANGDLGNGADVLEVGGTLHTGGGAFGLGGGTDAVRLHDTAVVSGILDGAAGTDRLTLAGSGSGTLDVATIGAAATYRGFEELFKEGGGTWTLTGTDASATPLDWTVSAGTLVGTTDSLRGTITNNSTVHFNQATAGTYAGTMSGTGALNKLGTGTVTLTGASGYSGPTTVSAGTLLVNGSLGNTAVSVAPGARLGGLGSIAGAVTIDSGGTLAPGLSPGTLTVGSLNLFPSSILDYELATPGVIGGGVNDLISVTDALTLDGILNVTGLPGFGTGAYRLIEHGGALTDNQLGFGTLPLGFAYQIQTAVPGQVNLLVSTATFDPIQYWDGGGPSANGVVNGGSGIWNVASANWTNATGTINQGWGGQAAVFGGAAGTVMVEGSIDFDGLDVQTNGYAFVAGSGGTLRTSTGSTIVRAASGVTARIGVPITGGGRLDVRGRGTIILTGNNSYTGGTAINGGTLSISSNANLGAAGARLFFNGGTLRTTADMVLDRATMLGARGGTIDTAGGTTATFTSALGGIGSLDKAGGGRLVLTGTNTYTGGTEIRDGALQIGNCGTTGSIIGDVTNDGVLGFSRADTSVVDSSISGSGGVFKECTGALIMTGTNTYAGGTLITAGALQGDTRSLQGEILDNAALVFDQATDGVFDGTLSGAGNVTKRGAGTLLLAGAHGVRGLTTVGQGTLALDGALAGAVTVETGATFDATGTIGGGLTVDGTVSVRSLAAGGFGLLGAGGDVVFNSGSEYRVNFDAAGNNSALVTPGRAVIGGATVAVTPQANDFSRVTHYAVLRADAGLSGSATATSSVATLEPYLSQNDTTLFATLLRTDLPLQPYAVSVDGSAIAAAFDRVKGLASGDLARVIRELTALDDTGLGAGLDMVAGELHASATQLAAMDGGSSIDMIRDEITHRVSSRRSGLDGGQGPFGPALWRAGGRRGWLRLRTEHSTFEADGAHGGNASLHGYAMGADWILHQRWLMGVGGSYANGRLTLDGLDESSGFTAPRGFAYVGYAGKAWALDGGLSVARTAYDIRRRFQFTAMAPTGRPLFGGVDREAASEPSGLAADVWGEARVGAMLGSWNVQPTVGVRRSHYGLTAWSETGGDALSLSASAQAIGSTQIDASVRFTRTAGRFHPFLSTRLHRELTGGRTTTTLRIGDGPAGDFDIEGLRLARHTIVGQAGFSFLRNTFGMSMWYEAHRARRQMRHIVQFAIGVE